MADKDALRKLEVYKQGRTAARELFLDWSNKAHSAKGMAAMCRASLLEYDDRIARLEQENGVEPEAPSADEDIARVAVGFEDLGETIQKITAMLDIGKTLEK